MENKHYVFVYGTLKKEGYNNYILESGEYVCDWVLFDYLMINLGAFPTIVPSKGYKVEGELYKINESVLKGLDILEGVKRGLYTREKEESKLWNKKDKKYGTVTIYMYVYGSIMEEGIW